MNELLQKHGCANVFTVPEGLKELMSDITREVLRAQPANIFDFIANYLSVLLITREHGVMAVKILDDLCDCRPSVAEHLAYFGIDRSEAEVLAQIISDEISSLEPVEGKEKVRECTIVKKILTRIALDEDMTARVCQVIRNAYRDYWYRKKLLEKNINMHPSEPWEIAAEHTLELYKRTKPSFEEISRATVKIQAAYRGYHVRRNILRKLKPVPSIKKSGPKVELPGPPVDVAGSREIDLGRILNVKPRDEDVSGMFDKEAEKDLGLSYDPLKTITLVDDLEAKSGSKVGSQKRMKFSSFVETDSNVRLDKSSMETTSKKSGIMDRSSPRMDGKSIIGVGDKSSVGVFSKSSAAMSGKSSAAMTGKSVAAMTAKSSVGMASKSAVGVSGKSSVGVALSGTRSEIQSKAVLSSTPPSELAQMSRMRQGKSTIRQPSVPIISFDEKPKVFTVDDDEIPEEPEASQTVQELNEDSMAAASGHGGDVQEVPEDITGDDTYQGDDTVQTRSTANSTDVEDMVSEAEEAN